ncbi:MAG: hypothetical protein JWP12_3253 [Bacteroidetes bacterium]|nr:hypothetical protein [Bacteroidota bacterium]
MRTLFTFLCMCFILAVHAQMRGTGQIMMLHPSLGNTITLNEKQKFGLFPQQPDSTFETAQLVKYDDTTYTILFRTVCDDRFENTISINELLLMYIKVEQIQPAHSEQQVAAAATDEKKSTSYAANKNGIPVLDVLGSVIHASVQILAFLSNFDGHHSNSGGSNYSDKHSKYDASQSYLTYPQDHYIPKDGEDN